MSKNPILDNIQLAGTYFSDNEWKKEPFYKSWLECWDSYVQYMKKENRNITEVNESDCYVCAIYNNEVIGFFSYRICISEDNAVDCRVLDITNFYVKENYRRLGIATCIITSAALALRDRDENYINDSETGVSDIDNIAICSIKTGYEDYDSFLKFFGFELFSDNNNYVLCKSYSEIAELTLRHNFLTDYSIN